MTWNAFSREAQMGRKSDRAPARGRRPAKKVARKRGRRAIGAGPPKRRRGRPKGSRTRPKAVPANVAASRDLSSKHRRDGVWMIVELHDQESDTHTMYDLLECEIVRIFGDRTGFFIPAYVERVKDKCVGIDLIAGYVFIEKTEESESMLAKMQSPYLRGEIRGNRPDTVTGGEINKFKRQIVSSIKDLAPKRGDIIVPKVGTFKNLEGKVKSVARDRRTASVVFKRSSRTVQAPISVLNMEIQQQ